MQRKEHTSLNSNSETQQSNMQELTVNWIPANCEQKENLTHIPVTGIETSQMRTLTLTHDMEELLKQTD